MGIVVSMSSNRRVLKVDSRCRVTLGSALTSPDEAYEAVVDDEGIITLYPVTWVNTHTLSPEARHVLMSELED